VNFISVSSYEANLESISPIVAKPYLISASTGPITKQGRQRCAEAKTIHGNETRKARTERAEGMRRLRILEELGYALGMMSGPKSPGRKSNLKLLVEININNYSALKKLFK